MMSFIGILIALPVVVSYTFYKGIVHPWVELEHARCFNQTECPYKVNYTWDFYFDNLTGQGVTNFALGGYTIVNSEVVVDLAPEYPPWDTKAFEKLQTMVSGKNGSILVDLGAYMDINYNETLFLSSLSTFVSTYKVNGFIVRLSSYNMDNIQNLSKVLLAIQNKSVAALGFESSDWQKVKEANLTNYTSMGFVSLWPNDKNATTTFNTQEYAYSVIKNATLAGVSNSTLVLEEILLARSNYGSDDVGYSNMIYDFNADPHGNGTVVMNATTGDMYFFISQSQAVQRAKLSDASHLHGVMLQGNDGFEEDLYPWDDKSICYGLAHR